MNNSKVMTLKEAQYLFFDPSWNYSKSYSKDVEWLGFSQPLKEQKLLSDLYLSYNTMDFNFLYQLLEDGHIDDFSDPRLLTIAGLRKRGFTPQIIKTFFQSIGSQYVPTSS